MSILRSPLAILVLNVRTSIVLQSAHCIYDKNDLLFDHSKHVGPKSTLCDLYTQLVQPKRMRSPVFFQSAHGLVSRKVVVVVQRLDKLINMPPLVIALGPLRADPHRASRALTAGKPLIPVTYSFQA